MSINLNIPGRYSFRKGKEVSQMSSLAVNWIEEFLTDRAHRTDKKMRILEYGSGMSTVLFGKLFPDYEICSVEGDKEWYEKIGKILKEEGVTNVDHRFVEQGGNWRANPKEMEINEKYLDTIKEKEAWDLIINDGGIRESVGELVLKNIAHLLTEGGVYLRHDYEKAIRGHWIQTGYKELGYDKFASENEGYELLTVSGNGMWGYRCELGGIWKKDL